jgi:hypothetical protein
MGGESFWFPILFRLIKVSFWICRWEKSGIQGMHCLEEGKLDLCVCKCMYLSIGSLFCIYLLDCSFSYGRQQQWWKVVHGGEGTLSLLGQQLPSCTIMIVLFVVVVFFFYVHDFHFII